MLGYAVERLRVPKDTHWGARPAEELEAALAGMLSAVGVGGHEALRVFRDVLVPACRPMDDPMMLSYVPTAPTFAATLFDLVVDRVVDLRRSLGKRGRRHRGGEPGTRLAG